MKLSIVIVNYNVEYFLEQCLHSVKNAIRKIEAEVFVVDNASVDGSNLMVERKFQEFTLIKNKENLGFSRANNQAMAMAKGEYVLLLNPDTLVEEDTFEKVIAFMDDHPDAGGLGVKMIDGKGKFLPESKRGLPTPSVAFYKIFGLSWLFPKSKKFNQYHLGHLDKDKVHEIDVLSGAFMLMRAETLEKVGFLDETFFMYGEDIDLSYRITLGGYKNYYYPNTKIIHYKGESTKKGSLNYVFVFYNAMIIFAKKHFNASNAKLFSFFINIAIYLRAVIAVGMRVLRKMALPVMDFIICFSLLWLLKIQFESFSGKNIIDQQAIIAFSSISFIWIFAGFLIGNYDKNPKFINSVKSILGGSLLVALIYSFLPETMRFSRAIVLLTPFVGLLYFFLSRMLLGLVFPDVKYGRKKNERFLIIGGESESQRIIQLLNQTEFGNSYIRKFSLNQLKSNADNSVFRLSEIIQIDKINEVVFCAKDLSSQEIINIMAKLEDKKTDFKIAPPESLFIIGSNSIKDSSELFILDLNTLSSPSNRRNKRILDVSLSILFLILYPIVFLFIEHKLGFFKNIVRVLSGNRTWVGFCPRPENKLKLPSLKKGIISPVQTLRDINANDATKQKLNIVYARNYKISSDLSIIQKGFKKLGAQYLS
ncbi:MAG: glycosyltransferase [Bacteroidota bacterium]